MNEPDPPPPGASRHPLPATLMHDLRTPLNHIIGYSELLMEQAEEEGHPGLLPHLEKVRAAGHHLLGLLDEHFVASRTPEAGERSRDEAQP